MILRLALLALLLGGAAYTSAPPAVKPAEDAPQIIRPARQGKAPPRAMAWSLLIDPLDQVEGNAAPLWFRAGTAIRAGNTWHKWVPAEFDWSSAATPLNTLPIKKVQALLEHYKRAVRLARQAAVHSRCDWEYPPVTMQTLSDLPMDEVQLMRELIRLITLHCRVELAQGRFDEAIKDMQVGFTLARHTGGDKTLIQDLVAIAMSAIMFSRVEEWIQIPGSPNLYWALTELPRPLVDTRHSLRHELGTIYRSFPTLRELKAKKLSADEANTLAHKFFASFAQMTGEPAAPSWTMKLGTTALAMKYYPTAKKGLVERGRTQKEVDALPVAQAVALYILEEYDRARDEFVKCFTLPSWQAFAAMEKIERVELARAKESGNFIISQLMPAISKTFQAQLRVDRYLAGLRAAEAIRLHIARHGKPPAKLVDVTEVPLPIDPFTGKGLDAWYSIKDGKAILDVPPPPGMTARLGKRFEFPIAAP